MTQKWLQKAEDPNLFQCSECSADSKEEFDRFCRQPPRLQAVMCMGQINNQRISGKFTFAGPCTFLIIQSNETNLFAWSSKREPSGDSLVVYLFND